MKRRGKHVALLAAAVGVVVLVGVAFEAKDRIREEWYLWRLSSEDVAAQVEAVHRLGRMRNRGLRGLELALRHPESGTRAAAAIELKYMSEGGLGALTQALSDENRLVRYQSALVLGTMQDAAAPAAHALAVLLEDRERGVRDAAMNSLLQIGGPGLVELYGALHNPDASVRLEVVNGLGSVAFHAQTDEVVSHLMINLSDGDARVQRAIIRTLGRIGPPASKALGSLRVLNDHQDEAIRQIVAKAIESIQGIEDGK
jgi:HEAT repeat protein